MRGIYKRYRAEKKKKIDEGKLNSQESGVSLVENVEPMNDILPPPNTSSSEEEEEVDNDNQGNPRTER